MKWFLLLYIQTVLYYAAKAHECHSQEASSKEGDRSSLHCFWHFSHCQLLAHTCEQYQCYGKAQCCCDSEKQTCQHAWLCPHRQFISTCCYHDSHTKQAAVGGNQWQEHAQCLIQSRRDLLQYDLNHLHQSGNHQDEQYSLQETKSPCVEQLLQQIGNQSRQCHNESYSCTHTQCCANFLTYSQKWANTQELAQYDIINEYRRDKYQEIYHNLLFRSFHY